jgi:hypothetical protein
LTESEGLPFDEGMQAYYLALGPRLAFPLMDSTELLLFVQAEFVFGGFQSNSQVMATGNARQYLGTGGWMGVEWVSGGLLLEAAVATTWLPSFDTALMLGVVSVGFSGLL